MRSIPGALESILVQVLRTVIYGGLLLAAEYAAHQVGLLDGSTLANQVFSCLKYWVTGVYATESSDIVGEADSYANLLHLRPGMTICEMGAADGSLMARVGKHVMPGGTLIATSPSNAELRATAAAAAAAGLGTVRTYLATSTDWAPGLPPDTCDAIYSRMVIHMVRDWTIQKYIPQWAAALKPNGRMFMTDHNPSDGRTGGPKRPIEWRFGVVPMMWVLPQDTEVAQITKGGPFELLEGPFYHPFFYNGYGAVYGLPGSAKAKG